MANNSQLRGQPFSATNIGTTTGTITFAATPGKTYYVTDISASNSGGAGTVVMYINGTATWFAFVGTSTTYVETFNTHISGAPNQSLIIGSGNPSAAVSYISVSGYSITTP